MSEDILPPLKTLQEVQPIELTSDENNMLLVSMANGNKMQVPHFNMLQLEFSNARIVIYNSGNPTGLPLPLIEDDEDREDYSEQEWSDYLDEE